MTGRYYSDGSTYPWYAAAGYARQHKAHLKALKMSETDSIIRTSKNFTMIKSVHRHQIGRGARFQNHKVTSWIIKPTANLPSRRVAEAAQLAGPHFIRMPNDPFKQTYYQEWKYYDQKSADKAWVLLGLKYS